MRTTIRRLLRTLLIGQTAKLLQALKNGIVSRGTQGGETSHLGVGCLTDPGTTYGDVAKRGNSCVGTLSQQSPNPTPEGALTGHEQRQNLKNPEERD